MNIDKHVDEILRFFSDRAGILKEILWIGAWARYFYRNHFPRSAEYQARLATKDLDILLDRKKMRSATQVDVHAKLLEAGFRAEFFRSSLMKYYKADLELEFLVPARGGASEKAVNVRAYNLHAQELPYLEMLWSHPVTVPYGKHRVRVPDPIDYSIHKLIVSFRRSKKAAGDQDRQDAEEVLYASSRRSGFDKAFRGAMSGLNKKSLKFVRQGIRQFLLPDLRERLLKLSGYSS